MTKQSKRAVLQITEIIRNVTEVFWLLVVWGCEHGKHIIIITSSSSLSRPQPQQSHTQPAHTTHKIAGAQTDAAQKKERATTQACTTKPSPLAYLCALRSRAAGATIPIYHPPTQIRKKPIASPPPAPPRSRPTPTLTTKQNIKKYRATSSAASNYRAPEWPRGDSRLNQSIKILKEPHTSTREATS